MGLTTVIRGTEQKAYNAAYGINRYYEIHPTNNSGLNATLVFKYFDDELVTPSGTITESTLDLWRFDGADWTRQFATLNTGTKTLTKTSIPQFSVWTAGYSSNTPLPITLLDFTAECMESDSIVVTWTTASEIQNQVFVIEQSENATNWTTIAEQNGSVNSNSVTRYERSLMPRYKGESYLRLKQIDLNGSVKVFDPIYLNCKKAEGNNFTISPNPASDFTEIGFNADVDGQITLAVYSISGQLLKEQSTNFSKGYTSVQIDISDLAAGVYYLNINSNSGKSFKGNRTILKR